jgi:hypothetical protein
MERPRQPESDRQILTKCGIGESILSRVNWGRKVGNKLQDYAASQLRRPHNPYGTDSCLENFVQVHVCLSVCLTRRPILHEAQINLLYHGSSYGESMKHTAH